MAAPKKKATKKDTRFKAGNGGGPGRPLGSRNKLSEKFLSKLAEDFEKHGAQAIEQVRVEIPKDYLRVCAMVVRKTDPVAFKAPKVESAKDAASAMAALIEAVSSGDLTTEEATAISGLIENYRRTLETTEIQERLDAIEGSK